MFLSSPSCCYYVHSTKEDEIESSPTSSLALNTKHAQLTASAAAAKGAFNCCCSTAINHALAQPMGYAKLIVVQERPFSTLLLSSSSPPPPPPPPPNCIMLCVMKDRWGLSPPPPPRPQKQPPRTFLLWKEKGMLDWLYHNQLVYCTHSKRAS